MVLTAFRELKLIISTTLYLFSFKAIDARQIPVVPMPNVRRLTQIPGTRVHVIRDMLAMVLIAQVSNIYFF